MAASVSVNGAFEEKHSVNYREEMMSTGWNYSDLSKLAKMNGGPEMLISKIKAGSFQKGLVTGRKESIPWIIISALIAGGVLAYEEGPKLMKAVKNKFDKKAVEEEARKRPTTRPRR